MATHNGDLAFDTTSPQSSNAVVNSGAAPQPQKFSNPLSLKLKDDNYLPWRQDALAIIKCHKLTEILDQRVESKEVSHRR